MIIIFNMRPALAGDFSSKKFLLANTSIDTPVLRSDRIQPGRARWIPWTTPVLA